ncbi:X-linked lymphocyte-regulated protein 5C-like [Acomys russatus]|uniref:X-linked lymphocyte-regulated protein 5C-like n=1 Tax=Acomys russatus TaxID=60746 RepID=UPI0021E29B46|nr:X-linked lymphocyte-regulated protein 5C-like [Acomys russatus]
MSPEDTEENTSPSVTVGCLLLDLLSTGCSPPRPSEHHPAMPAPRPPGHHVSGDTTRSLVAKRKQFEKDINASFRSLNENLQSIFQTQQKPRQEHHSSYSEMCGPIYQKWLEDMERTREQEERPPVTCNSAPMKTLEKAIEDHKVKLEHAKEICDRLLKVW